MDSDQRTALLSLVGCSGSGNHAEVFAQLDRLARPVINEVFATVAGTATKSTTKRLQGRREGLSKDVQKFMTVAAGRNQAPTIDVVKAVVAPDVLKETWTRWPGRSPWKSRRRSDRRQFGGRKPTDDVIDISLVIALGTLLARSVQRGGIQPALGMMTFASGLASPFFLLGAVSRLPAANASQWRLAGARQVVLGFIILASA